MNYECQNVHIRPSNTKHTQYNAGNDKENPRIVVTLNESHLTKWTTPVNGRNKKKVKFIGKFTSPTDGGVITEMPIRLWIVPDNTLYSFLLDNKTLDGWFQLQITKSWGSFYDVVTWQLNERINATVIDSKEEKNDLVEPRTVKLQRIAEAGFQRIFQEYPGFLTKIQHWSYQHSFQPIHAEEPTYPLPIQQCVLIERLQQAKKTAKDLEQFKKEIQPTLVTFKVVEYISKWRHVSLLAGLIPLKFTDSTRDIIAEDRPFTNKLRLFQGGKVQTFFGHIGSHFEYAVEQGVIIPLLLSTPYALCLELHISFKEVDRLVQFETLYSKAELIDPLGPHLSQRIASRLVQQLRKHPLGWTSFDAFRVGNRQLHHEMLQDLGIEETLWMEQIRTISSMQQSDDRYFVSNLDFFDDRQVALVSDVEKEETVVRVLSNCGEEKTQYEINEKLLAKHIYNNFTMKGQTLDEDQKAALDLLLRNQVAVLNGPGGSGKTTIIKTVLDYLVEERQTEMKTKGGHDLVVKAVAPTGKAAVNLSKSINMPCSTCHKAVFGSKINTKINDKAGESTNEQHHQIDVLVIDEISMLDILVAGHLFDVLEKSADASYKQRIFLLGDVNQLPPVGPGQLALDLERYQKQLRIPTATLTKIHRYGEEMTTFNQAILRQVDNPGSEQMDLSPFKVQSAVDQRNGVIQVYDMPDYAGNRTLWTDKALDVYCQTRDHLKGTDKALFMCTYTNEFCNLMNPLIQDAVNPLKHEEARQKYQNLAKYNPFLAQFRVNDKVYHTTNWYGPDLPELMNGQSGTVTALDLEEQTLTVSYDGNLIDYTKEMLHEHPHCITLAYCGTVHKAQGDGYHEVIYVANQAFNSNSRTAYTGCTRSMEKLIILTNQKIWDAQLANPYENRHSKMAWSLQE